jgi:excisionase family DNA binding protein
MVIKIPENDHLDRMLTVQEVAFLLHVHHSTVRRWEKSGALPSYRVGPKGAVRFKNKDVSEFVDKSFHLQEK